MTMGATSRRSAVAYRPQWQSHVGACVQPTRQPAVVATRGSHVKGATGETSVGPSSSHPISQTRHPTIGVARSGASVTC